MKSVIIILMVLTAFWSWACGSTYVTPQASVALGGGITRADGVAASADDPSSSSYLEATVPPCAAVEGSIIDPCERKVWDLEPVVTHSHPDQPELASVEPVIQIPWPPPDLESAYLERFRSGQHPHIIVRGVFSPGTTRCVLHEKRIMEDRGELILLGDSESERSTFGMLDCYMDLAVRDYVVGRGPASITVRYEGSIPYARGSHGFYKTDEYLKGLSTHIAALREGREFLVSLGEGTNKAVEVWDVYSAMFVQRRDDDRIVVTTPDLLPYIAQDNKHLYVREEWALGEIVSEISQTFEDAAKLAEITVVEDANHVHLREHLKRHGHYEEYAEHISLPPPFTD